MKLHIIDTGNFKLDGGAMFGVVPKVLWNKLYPADENNLCNWKMRCLLVETDNRKILIDNGIGNKQDEKFLKHYHLNGEESLEKSLEEAGFKFEEITDVLLTHLHFDHCGGSVTKDDRGENVLSFPNANYWISKAQWEWASSPNHREKASFLKENILPIKEFGKLKLIEEEGEWLEGINLKIFNGHTEGQIIPHIRFKDKTLVFMGDLLPSTAHIPLPWVMAYDTRPLLTLKDKERFFKEAIEEKYTLFFEHDLYNECCTIKASEKGPRLDETLTLNEFICRS